MPNKPKHTSFFTKKPFPQMPEGYYSGDQPNPNLRRFVEQHATPYDPASDDYHGPSFDQPIKTTKATAIYNMHTYWSKKLHDRDRPANPTTAADWLRQCRRAGLYELDRAIYEKCGLDFDALDEESYIELEEDYQLCVRRSG